jgi:hypothetical protein
MPLPPHLAVRARAPARAPARTKLGKDVVAVVSTIDPRTGAVVNPREIKAVPVAQLATREKIVVATKAKVRR